MIVIKKYLKYIGNLVTVVSIAFVIYAVYKLKIDFAKLANPGAVLIVFIGALGVTFTVYFLACAWKNTLDYLSDRKNGYRDVYCKNAECLYEHLISLPLYPLLSNSQQDKVIQTVMMLTER